MCLDRNRDFCIHNYLIFFYVFFVLLEDQGLPEEVLCNKKKEEKKGIHLGGRGVMYVHFIDVFQAARPCHGFLMNVI